MINNTLTDNISEEEILKDGIEKCEDLCPCGANLRLHIHTFKANTNNPIIKFYIDCENNCGRITDWHNTMDEAIDAFDAEKFVVIKS